MTPYDYIILAWLIVLTIFNAYDNWARRQLLDAVEAQNKSIRYHREELQRLNNCKD